MGRVGHVPINNLPTRCIAVPMVGIAGGVTWGQAQPQIRVLAMGRAAPAQPGLRLALKTLGDTGHGTCMGQSGVCGGPHAAGAWCWAHQAGPRSALPRYYLSWRGHFGCGLVGFCWKPAEPAPPAASLGLWLRGGSTPGPPSPPPGGDQGQDRGVVAPWALPVPAGETGAAAVPTLCPPPQTTAAHREPRAAAGRRCVADLWCPGDGTAVGTVWGQ